MGLSAGWRIVIVFSEDFLHIVTVLGEEKAGGTESPAPPTDSR